jgi:hypothetical protein
VISMKLKPARLDFRPGDFGAAVVGGDLMLPEDIVNVLASHGVRTAAELVSYLQTFPSAVAHELHWTVSDVMKGLTSLGGQLRGYVDDAILNPPQRPKMGYGALDPSTLRRRPS